MVGGGISNSLSVSSVALWLPTMPCDVLNSSLGQLVNKLCHLLHLLVELDAWFFTMEISLGCWWAVPVGGGGLCPSRYELIVVLTTAWSTKTITLHSTEQQVLHHTMTHCCLLHAIQRQRQGRFSNMYQCCGKYHEGEQCKSVPFPTSLLF